MPYVSSTAAPVQPALEVGQAWAPTKGKSDTVRRIVSQQAPSWWWWSRPLTQHKIHIELVHEEAVWRWIARTRAQLKEDAP